MPAPLANRLSHFEVDTRLDDWVAWAYANGINERIIGFLRFRPDLLFDFDPAHSPVAFPSPRSWEFAHRGLRKFEAQPELLRSTVQVCVEPAVGIELHVFITSLDQMPDLDAILGGGEVPVPTEVDLQYAAAALVGQVIRTAILIYAGRFPQREIGNALFKAPAFAAWAQAVADIMIDD